MYYCNNIAAKRLLLLLLPLCCILLQVNAQRLKKAEYFFDADPGTGKGIQLNLPAAKSIDSTFTFNVSALTSGLHMVYVRAQDTAGKWGLGYSAAFIKSAGGATGGGAAISYVSKIEYFFDKDPGVGKATPVAINGSVHNLDSVFKFDVTALANGLHMLYVRAQDVNQVWSLGYAASFIKSAGGAVGNLNYVTKLEYFFDKDPGVGKATQINFAGNGAILDSTLAFNVSGLTAGLHTIYVRAQDVNQLWSLAYNSSFIKQTGNDSMVKIQKLEYYVDVDPGFGNGIQVPITAAANISDTFNFKVADNGANARVLYVRAQDTRGSWSLVFDSTIDLCKLYKTKANFSWIRFANTYSFIDSTQNNPSHKLRWYFDTLGVDSVTNPVFNFPRGKYSVALVAGPQGCRADTLVLPIYSGLEEYYPKMASNGGDIIMNFYGGGLDTTTTITLINGGTRITPYQKQALQLKEFDGIFDLHNAPAGTYDVNVHYANGFDTTIAGGLQVTQLGVDQLVYDPEINVAIFGAHVARANTIVKHHLVITNSGGVVAKSVPVWIAADNLIGYTPSTNYTYSTPDNKFNYQDSVPNTIAVDSVFGEPYTGTLHNFMIPRLNTGESFTYNYTVKAPPNHGETYYMWVWNDPAMFGSPLKSWVGGCLDVVIDFGVGFVPGLGAVNAAYNYFTSDLPSFYNGKTSVGSFAFSTFSAVASIIPAANLITKIDKTTTVLKLINTSEYATNAFFVHAGAASGGYTNCNDTAVFGKRFKVGQKDDISADPNGISGPTGYGTPNYVNGKGKVGYEVYFENKPTASAPAQRVYITDTLDKTKYDLSTFELAGISLADTFINIPVQRKEYVTTIDLRPKVNLLLRYNAKLDTATGILHCSFLSLDPVTRDTLELSDTRGFLPPDNDGIAGTGGIAYLVQFKSTLPTNTAISNKASIVFDNNAPIITNTWLNTLDKTAPSGKITGSTRINDTTIMLHFTGNDVGAGIDQYHVFASRNNGGYVNLGYINHDTLRFTGQLDSSYSFYAIPSDSVNNYTQKHAADYSVTLHPGSLPLLVTSFTGQYVKGVNLLAATLASAVNVKTVELLKSADGRQFAYLGNMAVSPGINGAHKFDDPAPYEGKNYYRLRIIDNNGSVSFSNIVVLDNTGKIKAAIFPNPFAGNIQVQFKNAKAGQYNISIADGAGKKVYAAAYTLANGDQVINLQAANYAEGVYFATITDTQGNVILNQKIVKITH